LQAALKALPICTTLQAQRLAAAEALIKMQLHAGGAAGGGAPAGDVDGWLKRLAADVRMLKERLGDAAAVAAAGGSRPQGQVSGVRLAGLSCSSAT
jgi:hypothetical protein